MKIVIPMAGSGQRFVNEGYKDPKPMIRLQSDGRMIIEHVLDMFQKPGDEFIFICNNRHAHETRLTQVLKELRKDCRIMSMPEHKLGPVYTVMPSLPWLDDEEEVIVSYCDGTLKWDRDGFEKHAQQFDGCLLTHTGFHPHSLGDTLLASLTASDGLVEEVREKFSFTENPQDGHASSGIYYFKKAKYLKHYAREMVENNLQAHRGEFYVTLLYNLMIADRLRVGYYDTPFVAILGTPADVRNFDAWHTLINNSQAAGLDLLKCHEYWKHYWNH